MANVRYKQYTDEESKIYDEAMEEIMSQLRQGVDFEKSCNCIVIEDAELRRFIIDDALKIMIAEMYYRENVSLDKISEILRVPIDKIAVASMEMLEDAGISAAELYKKINPENISGNA